MIETRRLIEATCPECRGPLSEVRQDHMAPEYQCLVGHRYAPLTVLDAHSDAQEKALWAAVVALEEAAKLVDALAPEFPEDVARGLQEKASKKRAQAAQIRIVIEQLERF